MALEEEFEWPPLESNPEIFTEYMHQCGMPKEWAIGEVFGFEEDLLAFLPQPVLAVIANVERLKKSDDKARGEAGEAAAVPFYMKQTGALDNACGVIACLHSVYNSLASIGPLPEKSILAQHLALTLPLQPEARAAALEANHEFQSVHRAKAACGESAQPGEQSAVKHHFIAFVVDPKGRLLELDGTKQGPLVVAEQCADVLRGSIAAIQARLASGEYSDRMSLMTLNANQD